MSGTLPHLNGTHPSGEQPEDPAETKNAREIEKDRNTDTNDALG